MPDFPLRKEASPAPLPFISNVEYWFDVTGIAPTFTDTAVGAGRYGCSSPIYVPVKMTARKLYILNGTVVAGNIQMALCTYPIYGGIQYQPKIIEASITTPVAQAGTSVWQSIPLPTSIPLAPGLYGIVAVVDTPATAKFLSIWVPSAVNRVELQMLGAAWVQSGYPLSNANWSDLGDLALLPCMAVGGVP